MRNSTLPHPVKLLTVKEAAECLAISRRKLWSMTASGALPCIRIGRCVRYSLEDLQRWIESRKEGGQ